MKHTEYIVPIGEEAKNYDEMFIGVIRRQPELVRCKDCWCWNEEEQHGCAHDMEADDYCSKGSREEE